MLGQEEFVTLLSQRSSNRYMALLREKAAAALTGDDLEVASHQQQQVQGEVRHVHRTRSRS